MRKLAKQLQIDVRNFSEMEKKTKNERRFDVTLGYSITVRDVYTYNITSVHSSVVFIDIFLSFFVSIFEIIPLSTLS